MMEIWPAIDLRAGRCVRLSQGDFAREKIYADDPVAMAEHWKSLGATRLHLVDLDGARTGSGANRTVIGEIMVATGLPCQVGGGIREQADIDDLGEMGATRIVIGTQAVCQPEWFAAMASQYPGKLVLGLDAKDGWVAVKGWRESSELSADECVGRFAEIPLAAIVYTDISRDGMLSGPNTEAMKQMVESAPHPVVASGGVSNIDDISALLETGVTGCILGRALYEGTVLLPQVLELVSS